MQVKEVVSFICSDLMKEAVLEVLSKLPPDDLDLLQRRRVTIHEKDLSEDQLFGGCEYHPGGPWEKDHATVYLDFSENPLPEVRRGIIAHELAHIFCFHHRDTWRWFNNQTMTHQQRVAARQSIERAADEQAKKWGFGPELAARNMWKFELIRAEAERIEAARRK